MKQEHVWDVWHPLAGLDQCTKTTLNSVFGVEMATWPWKLRSMPPIVDANWENPKMQIWCKLCFSSSNLLNVIARTNRNFQEFLVKMAKMTMKVKVNDLHFQYRPSASQDTYLVQIWWFWPPNLWRVIARKTKIDRFLRQNGQTDLKVQVQWPLIFNTNYGYPMMQIWWF